MRFSTAVALLASASSAVAYTILTPNESQGWTNQGPQSMTWSSVTSDRANFTVVLTNTNHTLMSTDQVLAALVDGSLGKMNLNPPSAGWPSPGPGYVLNIVQAATDLNAILAQSNQFTITLSTVIPSSTSKQSTASGTASGSQPTDNTLPTTSTKSGALSLYTIPAGLVAILSLIPSFFA